jgi:hypothetical protein
MGLFIFSFLLFIIIIILCYVLFSNNLKRSKRIDNLENIIINNILNSLILYENLLDIDAKGYFKSDDEVGIVFGMLKKNIQDYLYLLNEIDVNIDDNDIIAEKLLNIKYLEKEITFLQKEEELYKLHLKAGNKKKSGIF